jgi:hypothetical protein
MEWDRTGKDITQANTHLALHLSSVPIHTYLHLGLLSISEVLKTKIQAQSTPRKFSRPIKID